jgi:hypothetical protein
MADFISRFKDELFFAGGVTSLGLLSAGAIWLARKKRKTPEHIHDISEINFGFDGPVTFIGKASSSTSKDRKIYQRELFTVMEKSTGELVDKQVMTHEPREHLPFCLKDRSGEVCFTEMRRTSIDFDPFPHYARQEEYELNEI